MLLTITTTHTPATDLGYLLHKNPSRVQRFELAFGEAVVFYPEVHEARCTAALLLDVDPVGLVRRDGDNAMQQYVNDRPYAATSFLSVAIVQVFRSAMSGKCKDKPELVDVPLPLELRITGVPCRGGEAYLQRLFAPLGYEVTATRHPLDTTFAEWGESRYFDVTLRATKTVHDALSHVYVLLPVLDDEKHYFVGEDEVEKLLRHGEGWLATHPDRNAITRRYLRNKPSLLREAFQRLTHQDEAEEEAREERKASEEEAVEKRLSLNERRMQTVVATLKAHDVTSVIDLGCGEGRLLRELVRERSFKSIAGMDVSSRALGIAVDRLHYDRLPPRERERLNLFHGSLMYRDARLEGFDAATAIEVIEHLDPPRLTSFERVVLGEARPKLLLVTTPNAEFNVRFESLPAGRFRHRDHRFEWTRAEFRAWCERLGAQYGYTCDYAPIGDEDPEVGPPTQLAIFKVKQA
ncbi:MAG TPA: 3' terminal RNA ribose 2'-O-methyltransferase Hen1 [Thermoanaerobaculia bacterium]